MKKFMLLMIAVCFLFAGCKNAEGLPESEAVQDTAETVSETLSATTVAEQADSRIYPLPDTTMDNLADAILSISLEKGDAYVDNTGKMQMDLKIYSYDKYDMVDISMLKVGDILVTHDGEIEITTLSHLENGTILINGGLDEDGIDLITDETGIYYEIGYSAAKNWYQIGEATIAVSADFIYYDTSDLDKGEILYYPGSFLNGEVTDYYFTPYNTTIRVENGLIMEMYRAYTP